MTAKDILSCLVLVNENKHKEHSQLVLDLQLIETELPNELQTIYNHMDRGDLPLAFENIRNCSAEIRAKEAI